MKWLDPFPFKAGKHAVNMEQGHSDTDSAVKLYKNFNHFKYSLRVNKKNILGEYSLFFKRSTSN